MHKVLIAGLAVLLLPFAGAQAGSISYNGDYAIGTVTNDLDGAVDWAVYGDTNALFYSQKIGSGIEYGDEGGGVLNAQNRAASSFYWSDGTGTQDNTNAPAAFDPFTYRRRQFTQGVLSETPAALDTSIGAYFTFSITAKNTDVNTVTVFSYERRVHQVFLAAMLTDASATVTNASLAPVLMSTTFNGGTVNDATFSFDFQADQIGDVLTFTLAAYNDPTKNTAGATDRALGFSGMMVNTGAAPVDPTSAQLSILNDAGLLTIVATNISSEALNTLQGKVDLMAINWADIASTSSVTTASWPLAEAETNQFFRVKSENL